MCACMLIGMGSLVDEVGGRGVSCVRLGEGGGDGRVALRGPKPVLADLPAAVVDVLNPLLLALPP